MLIIMAKKKGKKKEYTKFGARDYELVSKHNSRRTARHARNEVKAEDPGFSVLTKKIGEKRYGVFRSITKF